MPRSLILSAIALCFGVSAAGAVTVTVPTDYPTIQAAIASGADVVNVPSGDYPEDLTIGHSVVLQPTPSATDLVKPRVRSATLSAPTGPSVVVTITGMRFTGAISGSGGPLTATVQDCQVDGGLSCHSGLSSVTVLRCIVRGNATIEGFYSQFRDCQVLGGTLTIVSSQANIDVTGNYVEGPAPIGINAGDDVTISNNVVRGCVNGIYACGDYASVRENLVEDCSGIGILSSPSCATQFLSNTVLRCGGTGILSGGKAGAVAVQGNTVATTGSFGIDVPATTQGISDNDVTAAGNVGIRVTYSVGKFLRNRVLSSVSSGVLLREAAGSVQGNVSGRNGGAGFVIDAESTTPTISANTSFLNGGSGYDVTGIGPATLDHNIAHANTTGLRWLALGSVALSCNDWYGNTTGAVSGASPGATDLFLNPLFCALTSNDVHLSAPSPLAAAGACGRIGALPVGCSMATAVLPEPDAARGVLRVSPQPASHALTFGWDPLVRRSRLEILDVAGARVWSRELEPGSTQMEWALTSDRGEGLPPGIYFARLSGASVLGQRVVVVR